MNILSYGELCEKVKSTLPEKRYLHTLEVEKEVLYLADMLCPEKKESLSRAALLHDITKYLTPEEHNILAGDILTEDDLKSPETLHAISGAVFAKRLGEKLWRAIECHTTGKPGMTLEEMILFAADYTEATRVHPSCIAERTRLHSELEGTADITSRISVLKDSVARILDSTVRYLREKKTFIHPRTLNALDFMRKEQNEQRK